MREGHACELRVGEVVKEKGRRVRLRPINREQMVLRPMDVERLVPEDHEVRAIWEFVGRVDLSPYYEKVDAVEGEAGRSAFDPRLMIIKSIRPDHGRMVYIFLGKGNIAHCRKVLVLRDHPFGLRTS